MFQATSKSGVVPELPNPPKRHSPGSLERPAQPSESDPSMTAAVVPQIQSFIENHLKEVKRLQPSSIRMTQLVVGDLTFDRLQRFLRYIEESRGNHARTLNHRLAVLRTLFEYLATANPQLLPISQKVAAVPVKRGIPPRMSHIDREEVAALFRNLPRKGRHALRDGALVLFLYNTGARVQEVADVRISQLDLGAQPKVEFDGSRRRTCPLWGLTARSLEKLLAAQGHPGGTRNVFCSSQGVPLTRFGIYKIVRRHAGVLETVGSKRRPVRPQVFRSAAPDRLDPELEATIRGWLNIASNEARGRDAFARDGSVAEAGSGSSGTSDGAAWKDDRSLLDWLNSL